MESIYVENYMNLSDNEKKSFLSFMNSSKDIEVSSLEMIFSEGALLVNLLDNNDSKKIYSKVQENKNLKVDLVKKHLINEEQTILSFPQNQKQIRV